MSNQTNPQIKVGDVVHLNSGSPALTVTLINRSNVKVTWVNENEEMQSAVLPIECVILAQFAVDDV